MYKRQSQNHGYAVDNASLDGSGAVMRFVNVNDGSCEGLDYPGLDAFSLQFHPCLLYTSMAASLIASSSWRMLSIFSITFLLL